MITQFRTCKNVRGRSMSIIFVVLVMLGFAVPIQAQEKPTLLKTVQGLDVHVSKGDVTVYYADGYKNRVTEVQPLVAEMERFYSRKLKIKHDFSVAILTRKQWEKNLPPIPYGLPFVDVNGSIAFLPATQDGAVTAFAISLRSTATPAVLATIKQCGYDFAGAAWKLTDLIALHELGHVYERLYGIKTPTRWLDELVASYFAYAFLKEEHPKLAVLMKTMASDLYIHAMKPKHRTLADFEEFYLNAGPDNYSWYQGQFLREAAAIYDKQGLGFLASLEKQFPSGTTKMMSGKETLR